MIQYPECPDTAASGLDRVCRNKRDVDVEYVIAATLEG